MFISPTEPPIIRECGITSPLPEEYGADILWHSKMGTVGIQRKQFPSDFVASINDGRLNKEFQQMKQLDVPMLVLEGKPRWTTEGALYGDTHRGRRVTTWTRSQLRSFIASVQLRGVQVHTTDSLTDTVDCINGLRVWTNKEDHSSLDRRPSARSSDLWGIVTNEDYVKWLYQSLPGIGPKAAGAIWARLGMIFQLKVGPEELAGVPGIGKVRAQKIMEVFNGRDM